MIISAPHALAPQHALPARRVRCVTFLSNPRGHIAVPPGVPDPLPDPGFPPFLLTVGAKSLKRVFRGSRRPSKDWSIASTSRSALCSATGHATSPRHPSAATTRPDGTAALRGPATTDPDTPARSAAGCDRRPAAAAQRLGIYGRRSAPLITISTCRLAQREQTGRSRQSRTTFRRRSPAPDDRPALRRPRRLPSPSAGDAD
jgi:hypothetical protein